MKTQNTDTNQIQKSRRHFLKKTSASAMALATAGQAYCVNSAPRKIRIGIVGGRFGASFYWHEHPDCEVAAVSDLRPDRRKHLMKVYNCSKSYDSLEELVLDDSLDAVGIFTDGPLHVDHTIKAMKHGKHVISAVPCAWGSVEQIELLLDTVKKYGLRYMMAETSYFAAETISARKMFQQGKFGELYFCDSMYQHDGLDHLFFEGKRRTWRYGVAPMHYPTHTTANLIGVTGERLTEVTCQGWGDDSPVLKDNVYNNPFWNETAQFKTSGGHAMAARVWWKGAHRGKERAEWIGSKMSLYGSHPNGDGPMIVRRKSNKTGRDDAGFVQNKPAIEPYKQPDWWATEMLPKPLRHNSGHRGSHTFLTHEFIDALAHDRDPVIDVYESIAYTIPGIIAHQSALDGGTLLKIPQYDPK